MQIRCVPNRATTAKHDLLLLPIDAHLSADLTTLNLGSDQQAWLQACLQRTDISRIETTLCPSDFPFDTVTFLPVGGPDAETPDLAYRAFGAQAARKVSPLLKTSPPLTEATVTNGSRQPRQTSAVDKVRVLLLPPTLAVTTDVQGVDKTVVASDQQESPTATSSNAAPTWAALGTPAVDAAAAALLEGIHAGLYNFDRYKSEKARTSNACEIDVCMPVPDERFPAIAKRASILGDAVNLARDLVNEPAAVATPENLATVAEQLAENHEHLSAQIFNREDCERMNMNMFLAVAQASDIPPKFIHLTWRPPGATGRVALVGKGVTFDSGGLSMKPSEGMLTMKIDMAGAAAVIATMKAVAEARLPIEVHMFAACAENMVSGRAYKLGDVLRSRAGITVEINNTDAEGRLTLGDAITCAVEEKPEVIIDIATLTGACRVALGPHIAGAMTNHQPTLERLMAASTKAGERYWQLPLPPAYTEHLHSHVADMKNTGKRPGGALSAGLFLKRFVQDIPWVHLDIVGPCFGDKPHGHHPRGATGFGVTTMFRFLEDHATNG